MPLWFDTHANKSNRYAFYFSISEEILQSGYAKGEKSLQGNE
jgi:hypothetical protein